MPLKMWGPISVLNDSARDCVGGDSPARNTPSTVEKQGDSSARGRTSTTDSEARTLGMMAKTDKRFRS